ncbi:hypothetical protein ACTXQV_68280, partial [Klebsiella pneumoniae]
GLEADFQVVAEFGSGREALTGLPGRTYYTAPTLAERKRAIDENRRALDDAATLNAACYMQVVGDMAELGAESAACHREVGEAAKA